MQGSAEAKVGCFGQSLSGKPLIVYLPIGATVPSIVAALLGVLQPSYSIRSRRMHYWRLGLTDEWDGWGNSPSVGAFRQGEAEADEHATAPFEGPTVLLGEGTD